MTDSTVAGARRAPIPVVAADAPPRVIAPDGGLFAARAQRFDQLAAGHPLEGWLRWLARITRAQDRALHALPPFVLPDDDMRARARIYRMPILPAQGWRRASVWRDALRGIVAELLPEAAPASADALRGLTGLDDPGLELLADRLLRTEFDAADAARLPYIGAALQVLWTAGASRLGAGAIESLDVSGVCPCCGFLPVASILRRAGQVENLRYLHCALCNTEWHLTRVQCAACDATDRIEYRSLEGEAVREPGAVRAETCGHCNGYLKILHPEKGAIDPVADDLASLALDILVDEAGFARVGPNLLFMPGASP